MPGRIAGMVVLALILLIAARLGAPLALLLLVAGANLATLFLPGGAGAKAAGNLARRLYDRSSWESTWSDGYLPGEKEAPARDPWERTLEEIRALPETRRR